MTFDTYLRSTCALVCGAGGIVFSVESDSVSLGVCAHSSAHTPARADMDDSRDRENALSASPAAV